MKRTNTDRVASDVDLILDLAINWRKIFQAWVSEAMNDQAQVLLERVERVEGLNPRVVCSIIFCHARYSASGTFVFSMWV